MSNLENYNSKGEVLESKKVHTEQKKIDPGQLEKRIEQAESFSAQLMKRVNDLGGTKEELMKRLKTIPEKIKAVGEKIRTHSRKLILFTGLGLSITAFDKLANNHEHHQKISVENSSTLIAKERAGAYVQGKSEWLAEHISPFGYVPFVAVENKNDPVNHSLKDKEKDRYDAWYHYLGLKQENATFEISPYRPSSEKDGSTVTYYRMPKHEASILRRGLFALDKHQKDKLEMVHNRGINLGEMVDGGLSDELEEHNSNLNPFDNIAYNEVVNEKNLKGTIDSFKRYWPTDNVGVMGRYTISRGKDEKGSYVSYYDKWDLNPGLITNNQEASEFAGVGKPFEIYGRIYYDPKTGEPVQPR